MADVGGQPVSAKTIERVTKEVGQELAKRRDAPLTKQDQQRTAVQEPPELAIVECDGGRIRTRQPGLGPGVHLQGKGWNETKNACLIRAERQTFTEDPQPDPPDCFCDPQHVSKIAETEALSVATPQNQDVCVSADDTTVELVPEADDWRPKRLVRTVLSSIEDSKQFGRQMQREAKRRGFDRAQGKAFVGDGLGWNWTIWKTHFSDYTPILDFIHALTYLFISAKAIHATPEDGWSQYLTWMVGCWRGEIEQILEELTRLSQTLGLPTKDTPATDPRSVIATSVTYFTNNCQRMNYPEYRREGLPMTSAWMESLVKEINWRAKGTEMFWNNPEGAEAILQVRAGALSDDGRLKSHLQNRPGSPFVRQPKPPKLPVENNKS